MLIDIGFLAIQRALNECTVLLRYIKTQKTFAESDIRARTELSHARQSLNIIKDIIYGSSEELSTSRDAMNNVEAKVDDLLRFINGAMDTKIEAINTNYKHNQSLLRLYEKHTTIENIDFRVSNDTT